MRAKANKAAILIPRKWEREYRNRQGFTLIELSIVLVIIGLIVGGVLAGQSLIAAAAVRAQITQIEKFNTTAATFVSKYGYLPGDIPAGPAALFGFAARGQYAGERDGNGAIEGILSNAVNQDEGGRQGSGETAMFWVDLSAAKLIEGSFTLATSTADPVDGILANSRHCSHEIEAQSAIQRIWIAARNEAEFLA